MNPSNDTTSIKDGSLRIYELIYVFWTERVRILPSDALGNNLH